MIGLSELSNDLTNLVFLTKLAANGFIEMTWENGEWKFYTSRDQLEILTCMNKETFWELTLKK